MDYDEIIRQAEIVNWVFIIGTGIFGILIMAAIIAFIRCYGKRVTNYNTDYVIWTLLI